MNPHCEDHFFYMPFCSKCKELKKRNQSQTPLFPENNDTSLNFYTIVPSNDPPITVNSSKENGVWTSPAPNATIEKSRSM